MQGKEGKNKPPKLLTSPDGPKTLEGRASPGFGHGGSLPTREALERGPEAGPHPPTTDRTSKRAPQQAHTLAARSPPAPQPSPGPLPRLGEILDGCTPVRPLLSNLSLQFPPTLVFIPLAGTQVCPNSPASLLPPPPDPSLEEVLTCPQSLEALGHRSQLCAASPAPPRLPASRDAGVLPCSGQQPLPERVST